MGGKNHRADNCVMPEVAGATPARQVWTSQRAYIIASVAMVVGLGNLWRFPYMVGENGGGSFVMAYAICIFLIGVPLYALETAAGKLYRKGAIGVFGCLNARWGIWFGRFLIVLLVVMMSYYLVVSGWTLGYALDAVRFEVKPVESFTDGFASLVLMLAVAFLTFLVLLRGIAGLERTSKVLLPVLVVIVAAMAIYAQTLSGAREARQFYLSFNLSGLMNAGVWRMAASQAFYSLGVGQGILFAYGSYAPRHFNQITSSALIALTNSTVSILAGFMIFPIVFTFGISPDAGSQLSFIAFPRIMDMLPAGQVIGIMFYLLLFVAAFTSCVGGMAAVVGAVRDEYKLSAKKSALAVMVITALLAVPSALSFTSLEWTVAGRPVLEAVDRLTGSGAVIVAGIAGASLLSWLTPTESLSGAIYPAGKNRFALLAARWIAYMGRWLPAAAVLLLVFSWLS